MTDERLIRVLLVDDHEVVRQGLRYFLSTQANIDVIGEASSGAESIALTASTHPDVILMDIVMPDMDGMATTRAIKAVHPDVAILALTSYIDQAKVTDALAAGMVGYIMKDVKAAELARAIRSAAVDDIYLSPQAVHYLAKQVIKRDSHTISPEVLTERELDVLRLLTRGLSNQDIADDLQISIKTVKVHIANIFSKLGTSTRIQAALYALRHNLVPLDEL
jgi:NarL family two-component system response regulator LiaR